MRVLVFFDLPSVSSKDLKEYRRFRKSLIKSGFIMMQESVYMKLVLNQTAAKTVENMIYDIKPEKGLVQMLTITEKQFANIKFVVGESNSEYLNNDERLILL